MMAHEDSRTEATKPMDTVRGQDHRAVVPRKAAIGMEPTQEPKDVRALVVQPHTLVRRGMVEMLDAAEGLQVIAHSGSAAEAVRLAGDFQPDVVIVDADLPDEDGNDVVRAIREQLHEGKILVMAERATQSRVERTLGDGADGFTLKAIGVEEFLDTVTRVARGEVVLHPEAAAALARSFSAMNRGNRSAGAPPLTPRQREIVELLVMGLQNKQIARRLGIGVETVKTHISRIIERLGVSSRTEVVVVALRDGLVA